MCSEDIIDKLYNYKLRENRKTIEISVLQSLISNDYIECHKVVIGLVAKGYLAPFGKEHNKRPIQYRLFNNYKILMDDKRKMSKEEIEFYLDEINFKLYSKFEKENYKNNLELYAKHREKVLMLSEFLKFNENLLNIQCSINERSFEIFKDEKFLKENSLVNEIFKAIDMDVVSLNFYYTPEPFFYYSLNGQGGNILIVENKDTFYTIRKLFMENKNRLFDIEFSTVIYGEGKKIASSFEDIYYNKNIAYLNNTKNIFFYWGDIDKEGFRIYESLREQYNECNIKLLTNAYYKMLEISKNYEIQNNKKAQKMKPKDFSEFNKEASKDIQDIIFADKYIPQEIISFRVFQEV